MWFKLKPHITPKVLSPIEKASSCNTYLGSLDGVLDILVGLLVSDGVSNSDAVTLQKQPVVDHCLDVAVELSSYLKPKLKEYNVHQRAARRSQCLLTDDATDELSVFYQHLGGFKPHKHKLNKNHLPAEPQEIRNLIN